MTTYRMLSAAGFALLAAAVFTTGACNRASSGMGTASATPTFLDVEITPKPAMSDATLAHGRELFNTNCAHCHGEQGDGAGYGAPFLIPAPRNFVTAQYRFRSTASGQFPTDEDVFRTISRGATGTGMPPWQYLLNADDRWALVDYVKSFSPKLAAAHKRDVLAIAPPPGERRDLANGKLVYAKLQCSKCHGEDGRGVGPSAMALQDAAGKYINTRDFTLPSSYRTGFSEREIMRTMETGMNGTPMPSYKDIVSAKDEYDMVAYLMSLAKHGPGNQRRQIARSMEGVGQAARIISVREHAWKYEPSEIRIKAGEVVQLDFSTTDNGLGAGHGFAIDGFDQNVFINGATVGSPQSVTFRIDTPGHYTFYCSTQCSTTDLHPHMHGTLVVE